VLPYAEVSCGTSGCRASTTTRRVYLRRIAPGVVEMPGALLCAACSMPMETLRSWKDDIMPKITRHGGATNAAEEPAPRRVSSLDVPLSDARIEKLKQLDKGGHQIKVIEEAGEEDPSPGSSSETSSPSTPTNSEPSETDPPKPARSAGNRSKRGRAKASSTAPSTAGSGPETGE
jgi:hypothetical protein